MATGLRRAGLSILSARRRLDDAMQTAREAAIQAAADGTPETVIARELGVNRLTVRGWLGKSRS